MSKVASIEVYREIFDDDSGFTAKAETLGRLLLDTSVDEAVTARTDNITRLTVIPVSRVYPNLRYIHARAVGDNAKHLNRKMNDLKELMEDGRASEGIATLDDVHQRVAREYLGIDADMVPFYAVEFDLVDIVAQTTKYGSRNFVVLKSSVSDEKVDEEASGMLKRMSVESKNYIINHASERVSNLLVGGLADSAPVARIDSPDRSKAELLACHIEELLPVRALFSSEISIDTNS